MSATRMHARTALIAALLLVGGAALAGAQTASQIIRFRVVAQSRAEVAPVAKPISMRSTKSGVSTSSLALSTNDATLKVSASLDRSMPAGTSLSLTMGSASSGSNADVERLDTDATDVLTGMAATDGMRIPVSYRIDGTSDSASHEAEQRVVTYTILSAP